MQKKWLWTVSFGLIAVIGGCADRSDNENIKQCNDRPDGEIYLCPETSLCCAGDCVPEDDNNCGSCHIACLNGNTCKGGVCQCDATQSFCSNTCLSTGCVDLMSSPTNCGQVGNACKPGELCSDGHCTTTCSSSLDACNGSCVDLQSSVETCGSCTNKCVTSDAAKHISGGYCMSGECRIVCEKGYADVNGDISDGCEQEAHYVCGNGIVEPGEVCDGQKLDDQTCASIVDASSTGTLRCAPDCLSYNTESCSKPTTCGNGKVDGAEKCDGAQLNGATCAGIVGAGSSGTLVCSSNCMDFDTSGCSKASTCGNGSVDPQEMCDGDLINGVTCASVVGAGSTGTIKCMDNCSGYDVSGCTAAAVCGNDVIEAIGGEECEGNAFNGQTCETLIGVGSRGPLVCQNCKVLTTHCSAPASCGNQIIDGNELCDGNALDGKTCADVLGEGATGTLKCARNCVGYDISGCMAPVHANCGNNYIEADEACDGLRLNDQTCSSVLGYKAEGVLSCASDCQGFDTSGCAASSSCGNGNLEAGEVCDTTILGGVTCDLLVGPGSKGVVTCGDNCQYYNLSGCSAASDCNNGKLDEGEVCDGSNLNGATCAKLVGAGSTGNVTCGDGCKHFDLSSCSPATTCGNNKFDAGEVCDGKLLNGKTCADVVGYGSTGVLQCDKNCQSFNTTLCSPAIKCGNGVLDEGEICDGKLLNNATCASRVGWGSTGTLLCNDTCTGFDTTNCSSAVKCGNGVIDAGEMCDSANVGDRTCEQQVGHGSVGIPGCNDSCTGFTTGSCSPEIKCGNGLIDAGEKCDSNLLNGATCESVVGVGSKGVLKCSGSCDYDTSACSASQGCGNGKLDDGEACDKTAFAGNIAKCLDYAPNIYSSGNLSCTDKCEIDVSGCSKWCGNNIRNTNVGGVYIGEVCDTTKFPADRNTCEKVVGPGSTGTLVCADDCMSILTNQCTVSVYCGDGIVNGSDEWCDGTDFLMGTDDCSVYGSYKSGNKVTCRKDCTFDTSACVPSEYCGDGVVNGTEECDGSSFFDNETSCAAWEPGKYASGQVTCNNTTCKLDFGACVPVHTSKCGDGKLGSDELCDGNVFFDGVTCETYSSEYSGGTLKCTKDCDIDDSACVKKNSCGDGVVNGAEVCDGSKFLNNRTSCNTLFPALYEKGTVKCNSSCEYDVSDCKKWCGNGGINTKVGEQCDYAKSSPFPSAQNTCEKVVGKGYTGELKCTDSCMIDSSACKLTDYCGDGKVNGSEKCDKTAFLNNKSGCSDWNDAYASGNVTCNSDCTLNYGACVLKETTPRCGDGIINQSEEECDQNVFDEAWNTCEKVDSKYGGGTLKCTSGCTVDDSSCILKSTILCGNGKLDEDNGEFCDDTKFVTKSCAEWSIAFSSGNLKCTSDCSIDTSDCILTGCGDGIVNGDEECDGTKFLMDVTACKEWNTAYKSGSVTCNKNCTINTKNCKKSCGDGALDANEWCDGTKFIDNASSCNDWLEGSTGELKCTSTCDIDTSACKATPAAYCGDGIVNTDAEECDGNSFFLDVSACADYSHSYIGGNLKCNKDCKYDLSACIAASDSRCGDGILFGNEECDGDKFLLDITDCKDYSSSYASGKLKCTKGCVADTSACVTVAAHQCGNGKLDENEFCDGKLFLDNDDNCASWGDFIDGKITCSATCDFDMSNCVKSPEATCGDKKLNQSSEDCDGNEFLLDVTDCAEYSSIYKSGKLSCNSDCTLNLGACVKKTDSLCGNGSLDTDEWCDGEHFFDDIDSCTKYSWNYTGGTLGCNGACEMDTSACVPGVCEYGETRCYGSSLQMCDTDSTWVEMDRCGEGKNKSKPACWVDDSGNGGCYDASPATIVPSWCNFQWLDGSNVHTGYGRILLPAGYSTADVLGYMLCTDDLSKPLLAADGKTYNWDFVDASQNMTCSDCGYNVEYMTAYDYAGKPGSRNYCTFVFDFDGNNVFACLPIQTGEAAPIQIFPGKTRLTEDMTRYFDVAGCKDNAGRCINNTYGICVDGEWLDNDSACSGSKPLCDDQKGCVAAPVSYDNILTMDGWKYSQDYATPNTATYGDGSKITVKAAIYDADHLVNGKTYVIDGNTAIMNAKDGKSSMTISGLVSGIGTLSFQYASWGGKEDSARLIISDGKTSAQLDVNSVDTSAKPYSVVFGNSAAKQVTITMESKTANGRVLIDNVRWTSAF